MMFVLFVFTLYYLNHSGLSTQVIIWCMHNFTIRNIALFGNALFFFAGKMWTIQPLPANHDLYYTMNK